MKSILHLKDDTEYQIPLREAEEYDKRTDRAKVDVATVNPKVGGKKETEAKKVDNVEKVNNEEEATATQSQDDSTAKKKTDEISQEEINNEEKVNNENDSALEGLKDETKNQEQSSTEESSSDTTTESVPQVDTAKAALDEMKKLASQEGVIHPSLFISNFSKILGLMERAMQLQVKESGSATEESGSVPKEEAPKATEQTETTEEKASETTEKTELPAEGKQGELNGNNNRS